MVGTQGQQKTREKSSTSTIFSRWPFLALRPKLTERLGLAKHLKDFLLKRVFYKSEGVVQYVISDAVAVYDYFLDQKMVESYARDTLQCSSTVTLL